MEDNKNQNIKITPPIKPNLNSGVKFTNNVQSKPITKFEKSNQRPNKTIVTQEKRNKQTSKPKSKKAKAITLIISILVALSLLTTLVYFSFIEPTLPVKVSINFDMDAKLTGDQFNSQDPVKVMPGDDLDLSFILETSSIDGETSGDVYIRITTYAICENNYYSTLFSLYFSDNMWYEGNDGYYYYRSVMSADSKIDSVKYLHLNEDIGIEFANKSVRAYFVAEALQVGDGSIEDVWATAPDEWADMVS